MNTHWRPCDVQTRDEYWCVRGQGHRGEHENPNLKPGDIWLDYWRGRELIMTVTEDYEVANASSIAATARS